MYARVTLLHVCGTRDNVLVAVWRAAWAECCRRPRLCIMHVHDFDRWIGSLRKRSRAMILVGDWAVASPRAPAVAASADTVILGYGLLGACCTLTRHVTPALALRCPSPWPRCSLRAWRPLTTGGSTPSPTAGSEWQCSALRCAGHPLGTDAVACVGAHAAGTVPWGEGGRHAAAGPAWPLIMVQPISHCHGEGGLPCPHVLSDVADCARPQPCFRPPSPPLTSRHHFAPCTTAFPSPIPSPPFLTPDLLTALLLPVALPPACPLLCVPMLPTGSSCP